jgi:hypothetical protein
MEQEMKFRKTNTYAIFKQCVPDYSWQSVLDFGGNRGNLLDGEINAKKYTCLDISKEGLDALPNDVKSIHWNRHHSYYNPNGNAHEPFPKIPWHDIAFANSVFTHHILDEALYCIRHLSKYTNRIVFTYIDPTNNTFLEKFRDKYYDLNFDGGDVSYTRDEKGILWSAFDTEHLKSQLDHHHVETGTTDWFNYMDIRVRPETALGIVGY